MARRLVQQVGWRVQSRGWDSDLKVQQNKRLGGGAAPVPERDMGR